MVLDAAAQRFEIVHVLLEQAQPAEHAQRGVIERNGVAAQALLEHRPSRRLAVPLALGQVENVSDDFLLVDGDRHFDASQKRDKTPRSEKALPEPDATRRDKQHPSLARRAHWQTTSVRPPPNS